MAAASSCAGVIDSRSCDESQRNVMKIQIPQCDVDVTDALRDHVERRIGLALARFAGRIGRVIVRFSQVDGERLAATKRCQIEVGLRPRRLDVEDTDVDLFAAVNHATDRASRSIPRALEQGRR
jgi:ribosomal subunit interface protein